MSGWKAVDENQEVGGGRRNGCITERMEDRLRRTRCRWRAVDEKEEVGGRGNGTRTVWMKEAQMVRGREEEEERKC